MKTNITLWTRIVLMLIVGATTTYGLLISCEKEEIQPMQNQTIKSNQRVPDELMPLPDICGEIEHKDLKLSNRSKVGDVYIFNDRNNLYVNVLVLKGTLMKNAYLYIGTMDKIPLTMDMDPNFMRYTYIETSEHYGRYRKFIIPLSALSKRFTMSLMAETKVEKIGDDQNDETDLVPVDGEKSYYGNAWADGKLFGEINTGRFFTYLLKGCDVDNLPHRD